MKRTNFKRNKLGFMLSELLLVVAIIVVLVGLGVTGFVALRGNIVITKYDDLAREIYVAAQNQLIQLDANGMNESADNALKAGVELTSQPSDYDEATYGDWDAKNYYYAGQATDTMDVLLPLGAVADDVRSNGFYVIEYNAETHMVYSVFYSEKDFKYTDVSGIPDFRSKKSVRKDHMVGYYGGSAVKRDSLTHCDVPQLEIINNNELRLNILNPGDYTISVEVSDGEHDASATEFIVDKKTVLLDSINEKHFKELFPNLTPGKDLTITVTYSKEGFISSSASVTANSLFATREGEIVTVAWARHLQNLEENYSGLNDSEITAARQTEHIQWDKKEFGDFKSIDNTNLKSYDGSYLEIRDLEGTNGLFAKTTAGMELSGICVVNPVITASGTEPVGALVGDAGSGTTIDMCGVYSSKITDDGKVDYAAYEKCYVNGGSAVTGGLVGKATNTTVTYSFAALPSLNGGSGAALIGSASGCTIENSYANCDDLQTGFNYFVSGEGNVNTITHCYAVGNVASAENSDFCGNDTVTDCYYAVSHRQFAANWDDNVDLAATQFLYKGDGDWETFTQDQLQNAVETGILTTGWTNTIAPLSHPYRKYLDGRAFPYPAIVCPAIGALDHYGSWPDSSNTVDLTITMSLLNNEDVYAIFAGQVIVEDGNGNILFNSDKHKNPDGTFDGVDTIKVAPQTEVTIKVKAADGYKYINTAIDRTTSNEIEVKYKVEKNTEAVITFQQESFRLTGTPAVDNNNVQIDNASYNIDLTSPETTLTIPGIKEKEQVETGSTVTVRPVLPQGKMGSVVWYAPEGSTNVNERTYLSQNADGNYTFAMPAGNTEVHVMYTTDVAYFKIQYYIMDTEGNYPNDGSPTQKTDYTCGLGSPINQDMINAMTESSGLTVTIDGEKVLYFSKADVNNGSIYHSELDEKGFIKPGVPHITAKGESSKGNPYIVKIYIDRKRYSVTLKTGEHITGVKFEEDNKFAAPTVTKEEIYYGADVSAVAQVEPGYSFTYWMPQNSKFLMSSDLNYEFKMPAFDLELTAIAATDRYLVTINLLKNEESWLYSDPLRQTDPITMTLVNSKNPNDRYPMKVLTEDSISYAMQAVVPVISDYGEGYYIEVAYESSKVKTWIYTSPGGEGNTDNDKNDKLLLYVRNGAVEKDVHFYSITYHPNRESYIGSVPKGGVYPMYYHLMVEGNTGLLRDDTDIATDEEFFRGWKDYDAAKETSLYDGVGDYITITRRIDMFAQWEKYTGNVVYHPDNADGGEPPVDDTKYRYKRWNPDYFTVREGSLTRTGYDFIGWSTQSDAITVQYRENYSYQWTWRAENFKLHLYPVWKQKEYTVQFYDAAGEPLTGNEYSFNELYGEEIDVPGLTVDGKEIVGWSLTKDGAVVCRPGEKYTVTGDTALYARTAAGKITVVYKNYEGNTTLRTEEIGEGTSFYLSFVPNIGGKPTPVTAWSTEPNGKGELFICGESGHSEKAVAFTENTTLYAVIGKVYNYNKQEWFDTLYAAVRSGNTINGNTLIVYRDTEEPYNVWFNKSLYIISHGNRTVKWKDGATTDSGDRHRLDDTTKENTEFVGCMSVSNNGNAVTVHFGESDVSGLSMEGSTLTFDAYKQSRVISLANGATFHMYDGITLTNGYRTGNKTGNGNTLTNRTGYGGGVYAGAGSVFFMHGGTVSHCEAVSGGGVYLITGSRMYMGDMVQPTAYSATAIYYTKVRDEDHGEDVYINTDGVTHENYKQFYVTAGNPKICYNHSTHEPHETYGDGGGGLLMLDLNNGELTLFRGSITNNTTTANGGGVMTDSDNDECFLRIYEVDISHNAAEGNGGGIFQWHGTVYVYNSTIRQNKAKNGGGIYLKDGGGVYDIQFYFGDISDNEATENGGGVYAINGAKFFLRGGNLCRNRAKNGGGAYLAGGSSFLSFEKGTLSGNQAEINGGGVYSNGIITMSGGTLSGNRAENFGGGIYTVGTMTMTEGTVCDNSAKYLGGGIMVVGKFILSGGSLYGSTDTDYPPNNHCADEDNANPGSNDIYLVGANVITIPASGIALSGEKRVFVDFERDASIRFEARTEKPPYRFAKYESTPTDEDMQEDALYFAYFGTRSTQYSMNLGKNDLTVAPPDKNQDKGLYFVEKTNGTVSSSSVTIDLNYPGSAKPLTDVYTVNDQINMSTVVTAVRPGYYLAGWARTPDALEEEYELFYDVVANKWKKGYNKDRGWELAGNKGDEPIYYTVKDLAGQTLYAQWRPYVVVYDIGTDAEGSKVQIQSTSVGPHVTILNPRPMTFVKNSTTYYFKGWQDKDGKTYMPMDQVDLTDNLRLTAIWEPKKKSTITFHFNDGTSDKTGELLREVVVDDEGKYTIDFDVHRANKILDYWEDNEGNKYVKGNTIENVEKDMHLYAIWVDAVTLTYDVNGGIGNNWVTSVRKGESAAISERIPTRVGYTFVGWSETENATTAVYHPNLGTLKKEIGPLNQNITLYAVWVPDKTN